MLLTRQQKLFRGNGSAPSAPNARAIADGVIQSLNPAAWYRNATGVTSAGGFASQWDDYSGNGRHLVQGTATNQPAYSAGVFTFDGVDNYFKTLAFTLSQPFVVYVVLRQNAWTANRTIFDGNTDNVSYLSQDSINGTPNIAFICGTPLRPNGNLAVTTWGIVACLANGASSVVRVNNTADLSGNAGAGNAGGFTFGGGGGAGGNAANISTQEIVIFAAAHNDSTRSSVITALNNALTVF